MPLLQVAGARLEVERISVGREAHAPIVMLHEGLGSVAMWRDFPHRVAHAAGRDVVVYSRAGYGRSSAASLPYGVRYMHDEALTVLPALLDALGIARPFLFGHSDGASIALIHAGASGRPVRGLALMAPHVMVEDVSIASIEAAKVAWRATDLRARLSRHHDDVDAAFSGWCDVWLDPAFERWELSREIAALRAPTLLLQGVEDQYATLAQLDRIQAGAPAPIRRVELAARHSPHLEAPGETVAAIADFTAALG